MYSVHCTQYIIRIDYLNSKSLNYQYHFKFRKGKMHFPLFWKLENVSYLSLTTLELYQYV